MTVPELVERAKALTPEERRELIDNLVALDTSDTKPLTGAEIVEKLSKMPPVELVDSHIEDPVEWVARLREDERKRRLGDWGEDK